MPCVRQGNPLDWLDGRMGLQGAQDPPSRAKPTKSVSEANPLRWGAPCYAVAWHRRRCMNAPMILGVQGGAKLHPVKRPLWTQRECLPSHEMCGFMVLNKGLASASPYIFFMLLFFVKTFIFIIGVILFICSVEFFKFDQHMSVFLIITTDKNFRI